MTLTKEQKERMIRDKAKKDKIIKENKIVKK